MASSSSSVVSGLLRTNYARIGHAAQQLFPDILQELIKIKEPPQGLSHDVNNNNYLSNNLTSDEWSMINNVATTGYANFDISLLYKLIRNLNLVPRPTKGWGYRTPPSRTEVTTGDDIERIQRFRNKKLHRGNAQVTDTELSQIFTQFKDIAGRLETYMGKQTGEFVDKFVDLETCCMDEKTREMYIERIERLKKSDEDCKKRIQAVEKDFDALKKESTSQTEELTKNMNEQSKQINEGKEERHELKETQSKHEATFQTMGQKQEEQTKELKEWKEKQQDMKGQTAELTKNMNEQSKQINEGKEERHELKETQSKHATKFQTMGQKQEEQTKELKEWKEKQQDMKGQTEELTKNMNEQSKQINEGKEERHELKETQSKHAKKFQTMGQKQEEQTKEWKEWKEKQQDMKVSSEPKIEIKEGAIQIKKPGLFGNSFTTINIPLSAHHIQIGDNNTMNINSSSGGMRTCDISPPSKPAKVDKEIVRQVLDSESTEAANELSGDGSDPGVS